MFWIQKFFVQKCFASEGNYTVDLKKNLIFIILYIKLCVVCDWSFMIFRNNSGCFLLLYVRFVSSLSYSHESCVNLFLIIGKECKKKNVVHQSILLSFAFSSVLQLYNCIEFKNIKRIAIYDSLFFYKELAFLTKYGPHYLATFLPIKVNFWLWDIGDF